MLDGLVRTDQNSTGAPANRNYLVWLPCAAVFFALIAWIAVVRVVFSGEDLALLSSFEHC